jgi:hydroxypyruvate isomerase
MAERKISMEVTRRCAMQSASLLAAGAALTLPRRSAADNVEPSALGKTPHTKFAVNIEMWFNKEKDFVERLRKSAALGFPAVEFWDWRAKKAILPAIADVAGELGIAIAQFTAWGFFPGMNSPKNKDKFVKAVEEGCQVAKQLRCEKMTVVGGQDIKGVSQEEMHRTIIDALKAAAPVAEAHNVMLILEPMNIRVDHKGHCLYGSEAPIRICREVGSPMVKLNWDLYHMHISEGDLCRRLKEGYDQVGYLQLADNPGRNEPGTGEIYYPRVLKEAYDLGYRGFVGLECNPIADELTAAQRVNACDFR